MVVDGGGVLRRCGTISLFGVLQRQNRDDSDGVVGCGLPSKPAIDCLVRFLLVPVMFVRLQTPHFFRFPPIDFSSVPVNNNACCLPYDDVGKIFRGAVRMRTPSAREKSTVLRNTKQLS